MDARIKDFIRDHARNLIGLDVALFFQTNPQTFDTPEGLARRTHRDVAEVRQALDRLAAGNILQVFSRGEGRYQCYALAKTAEAWDLLCLLSEAYMDDLEARKEIVRLLMQTRTAERKAEEHANNADTQRIGQ